MRQIPVIRKTIAAILLLVFSIAGAPKAYFHDLVADHADAPSCDQLHTTSVLHKSAFDCDCDDLVVTTPFVVQSQVFSIRSFDFLTQHFVADYHSPSTPFVQYTDSRGPPAA